MDTLFTERHAIEIAFRNIEKEREERRDEYRKDITAIEDKQFYILDRLQALDDKSGDVITMGVVTDHLNSIETEFRDRMDRTVETIVTTAQELTAKKAEPLPRIEIDRKLVPDPKPARIAENMQNVRLTVEKREQSKPKQTRKNKGKYMNGEDALKMFIGVIKEAGKPVGAKYIADELKRKHGKEWANIHGRIKSWMDASGGQVVKIGSEYQMSVNHRNNEQLANQKQ